MLAGLLAIYVPAPADRLKITIGWSPECGLDDVFFDDSPSRPAAPSEVAGTRPALPEHQRQNDADDSDYEQDVASRVDVEAAGRRIDRPGQDRTAGD